MPIDYTTLSERPRLLLEVELKPLQGNRFQPTGFADLGAARYTVPVREGKDGNGSVEMLLVESAQSVANRLELACWDESTDDLLAQLKGLPYVRVNCGELGMTNSIKEFHRLNSPYLWSGADTDTATRFREAFMADLGLKVTQKRKKKGEDAGEESDVPGTLDFGKFYKAVFKWDPNSVIHGLFLEKVAGRLRMTRALSGFIEAADVRPVESGGAKIDHILPSPKIVGLGTDEGYGNVPFPRTEFVAKEIKAYFNLDLALLRGYGLGQDATQLLIALSLLKIRRFLSTGLRLRSACDLEAPGSLAVKPSGFTVPKEEDLLAECEALISKCAQAKLFTDPAITQVNWQRRKASKVEVELPIGTKEPDISGTLKKKLSWSKAAKNKGPKLKFSEGLDADTAEQAKALFPNDTAVAEAIDKALQKQASDTARAETDEDAIPGAE